MAQASEDEHDTIILITHTPDFYTHGLYLSGAFMVHGMDIYTSSADTPTYTGLRNSYFFQVQMELKHNLAINAIYSFTPAFHNSNKETLQSSTYGINGHFPCYRAFKHKGIYIDSGGSIEVIRITNLPTNTSLVTQIQMNNALGYEYKFKRVQLYVMTRLNTILNKHSAWKTNSLPFYGTVDHIVGIRLKLPSIYKKINDRYHWI